MRVLFDCRSVFPGMGGIGRYAACLAKELPSVMPENEIYFLLGGRQPEKPIATGPNVRAVRVPAAMIDPEFEQLRLPALISELEIDLYHNPCFSIPLAAGGVTRIATVHDVVFRRHPDLVEPGLRAYLDRWSDVSCAMAHAVLTVSEFSKKEIMALYECPEERIHVVPLAVGDEFFSIERRPHQGRPFILYVGALERKKNVGALLEAFEALIQADPTLPHELVLVGGQGGAPFDMEGALEEVRGVRDRVRVLGHVPEEELRRLYGAADLFCYLSAYEGFGLPPLEAMAARVPCVVSDRSSLPEVTGDGALLVDPDDRDAVAQAMRSVLRDTSRRAELVGRGTAAARRFSWNKSARELAGIYHENGARCELRVLKGGL